MYCHHERWVVVSQEKFRGWITASGANVPENINRSRYVPLIRKGDYLHGLLGQVSLDILSIDPEALGNLVPLIYPDMQRGMLH